VDSAHFYRVASSNVIRETFDDESVIVNLDTGVYYSLQGTASSIWEMVEEGHSEEAVYERLARRYSGPAESIREACQLFLRQLIEERLIVEIPRADGDRPAAPDSAPETAAVAFIPPSLAKFSDMQELLLLDPIHETDETGWPARKQ
jgi:hypothetical protein